MRVLLVEDNRELAEWLGRLLRKSRYIVDAVRDGADADAVLTTQTYDLVILDMALPEMGGLEVLKRFRARKGLTPVIILTANDAITSRIAGLDAGADDYLVKPFDLDELAARLRALVRRQAGRSEPLLRHGAIVLDPATRQVTCAGAPVVLSAREYAVLEALLNRPGAVLSKGQLEERIYGWGEEVASNAVEVHIHGLRKKLGADAIRTVRGVGYMMPAASVDGAPSAGAD